MKIDPRLSVRPAIWKTTSMVFFCILILASLFVSCEKDDICVEGDTPLLVIRFYDAVDTTAVKSVANLRIIGIGIGVPVNTFTDRSTRDSVALPLRVDEGSTSFLIIRSSAGEEGAETGNTDTLQFNYSTNEVFISRACGFVANYEQLQDSLVSDSDNWIQDITIVNPSVNSQLEAHVKIFH
ncbi:hypothetical protein SAMN06265375_10416 [Muriicola jejuensis]|nr:DUF6452 family protein [Muriicola jejuensis]SMP23078.1 hypothetical protein SAMN06265375_10416 [Muriicola jejuensis]